MSGRPVVSPEWLAGIRDTLALTRESLRALADDRRTQTVTWKQLDEALEALAASLSPAPETPAGVAGRLAEIVLHADTVIDIARTLTVERGDGDAAEVLTWAEALGASIRAHERDVELLMPFAPLLADEVALGPSSTRSRPWPICRTAARRLSPSWREPERDAERRRRRSVEPGRRPRALGGRRPLARATSRGARRAGEKPVPGDGVRLPVRPRATAALDRVPGGRRRARSQLLRPARLRSASRELRRDREGRRPGAALVPPRARPDAGRPRLGADLVVRIDVRVPDAVAGDARAGGEPARADEPLHRSPADEVRGQASGALGRFGIGVQRARHRAHLSVLELRRPRPGAEARSQRRRRRRSLRHGAGGDGGSAGRGAELRASGRSRWPGSVRLVRSPSTTRRRVSPKASRSRSCAPTWRTTRG